MSHAVRSKSSKSLDANTVDKLRERVGIKPIPAELLQAAIVYPWGRVEEIVVFGDYAIFRYRRKDADEQWKEKFERRDTFHGFFLTDGQWYDTANCYTTFEAAVLGTIKHKHLNPNIQWDEIAIASFDHLVEAQRKAERKREREIAKIRAQEGLE